MPQSLGAGCHNPLIMAGAAGLARLQRGKHGGSFIKKIPIQPDVAINQLLGVMARHGELFDCLGVSLITTTVCIQSSGIYAAALLFVCWG